jgi:hypothetical protein
MAIDKNCLWGNSNGGNSSKLYHRRDNNLMKYVRLDLVYHYQLCSFAHLVLSVVLGFLLGLACATPFAKLLGRLISLVLVTLVAVGKEIYDKNKPNPTGFSWSDLSADILGLIQAELILGVR